MCSCTQLHRHTRINLSKPQRSAFGVGAERRRNSEAKVAPRPGAIPCERAPPAGGRRERQHRSCAALALRRTGAALRLLSALWLGRCARARRAPRRDAATSEKQRAGGGRGLRPSLRPTPRRAPSTRAQGRIQAGCLQRGRLRNPSGQPVSVLRPLHHKVLTSHSAAYIFVS